MRCSHALLFTIACCSSPAAHPTPPTPPPDAVPAAPIPDAAAPIAEAPAPTLHLTDAFVPTRVRARVRIDPDQPGFAAEIWIDGALKAPARTVWLESKGLTIDSAELAAPSKIALHADQTAPQFLALRADAPIAAGAITLHLAYHGTYETAMSAGAFVQEAAGDRYVFSQFESISGRRVFPMVDEPWVKVPWQLTIESPAKQVALSNTGVEREDKLDGGVVAHHFAETKPLPSYLVAFAVGPFELVDAGVTRGGAPIRIAALRGRAKETAWAAQIMPTVVATLEDYFGVPYPYDKLDVVPIPITVGFGAMENAGLITYVEAGLLLDPKDPSLSRRYGSARTLAHETAHQWFGDLVTMPWWDDIWLNEAFANWMEQKVTTTMFPAWHTDLDVVNARNGALGADSLATARMIRQPIASENDIESAFDGITYGKGAAVIRMFEQWIGPDRFQKGVHEYLRAHAYGNATAKDFLATIGAAAGTDVATPFSTFLDQAGAPRITATLRCDAGAPPVIALHQDRYLPTGAPAPATTPRWQLPVCAIFDGGRACTMLTDTDGAIELGAARCPAWFYPNAGGDGYYRVAMSGDALTVLGAKAWPKLTIAERLSLAADVTSMVRRGDLELGVALDLVAHLAQGSPREVMAAADLASWPSGFVSDKQRKAYEAWFVRTLGAAARKLGWLARKGDGIEAELERISIVPRVADAGEPSLRAQAVKLAAKWRELPIAIRGPVAQVATADAKTFARMRDAVFVEQDRQRRRELLSALAHIRDPKRLAAALALTIDAKLDARETFFMPFAVRAEPATLAIVDDFLRAHADAILAGVPEQQRATFAYMLARPCEAAKRDALAALIKEKIAGVLAGPHAVDQAIEGLDQCIAQRALIAPALAKRFGSP